MQRSWYSISLLFISWITRKKEIYNLDCCKQNSIIIEVRMEFFGQKSFPAVIPKLFVLCCTSCISLDVCSIFSLTRAIPYLPLALLTRYHSLVLIGSSIPTNYVWLTCVLFHYRSLRERFSEIVKIATRREISVFNSSSIKYCDVVRDNRCLNWLVLIKLLLSIINTKRFPINYFPIKSFLNLINIILFFFV